VFVIGGDSISGTKLQSGLLYYPDLVTLHIRFQGTGKGSVTAIPSTMSWTSNADAQLALGLKFFFTAQPDPPYFSVGWVQSKGTKLRPARWTKSIIRHTNTFDGWGTGASLDKTNPTAITMDANRTLYVNFSSHTSSATLELHI
jgi:hypothetical protein